MKIPKIIHSVWIGPLEPPTEWIRTWPEKNPGWKHVMWDNKAVFGRTWVNQRMIDHYLAEAAKVAVLGEYTSAQGAVFKNEKATLFAWHVISDIVRYEILYNMGGFMPGADHVCVKPIPDAFFGEARIYTELTAPTFEKARQELMERVSNGGPANRADCVRLVRYDQLHASPVIAAERGNQFVEACMDELGMVAECDMGEAVDTTGNVFMARMMRKYPKLLEGLKMPDYDNEQDEAKALEKGMFMVHRNGTTMNRYKLGRKT